MAADETSMWLNGFSCIRPTDDFLLAVGRDVVDMVRTSMRSDREREELEPMGHVKIEISAS